MGKKVVKGLLGWNLVPPAGIPQIFIELFISGRVPRSEGPLLQCLLRIRDDLLPIDPDDPSKTLARGTGAERTVKREEKGFRFRKASSAAITGETSMEGDPLSALRDDFNFTVSYLEPSLNGFG
jgi:hypothetical protein